MMPCKVSITLFGPARVTSNDTIKGQVAVEVFKELSVDRVLLKLQGVASTNVCMGPYATYAQTYKELYQKLDLLEVRGATYTLAKGVHCYDFQFTIPEQLPPSFEHSSTNHIQYFLKATISRPGLNPNIRALAKLTHIPCFPFMCEAWHPARKMATILCDPKDGFQPLGPSEEYLPISMTPSNSSANLLVLGNTGSPSGDVKFAFNEEESETYFDRQRRPSEAPSLESTHDSDSSVESQPSTPLSVPHNSSGSLPLNDLQDPLPSPRFRQRILQRIRGRCAYNLLFEVWLQSENIYLGDRVPIKLYAVADKCMPRLILTSLTVSLVINTDMRAQLQKQHYSQELELFSAQCPVRLAAKPIMDLSYLLNGMTVPKFLAPSFRAHTMKRGYKLKIVARLSSNAGKTMVVFREDIKLHSSIQSEPLPLYDAVDAALPQYSRLPMLL